MGAKLPPPVAAGRAPCKLAGHARIISSARARAVGQVGELAARGALCCACPWSDVQEVQALSWQAWWGPGGRPMSMVVCALCWLLVVDLGGPGSMSTPVAVFLSSLLTLKRAEQSVAEKRSRMPRLLECLVVQGCAEGPAQGRRGHPRARPGRG